MDVVATIELYLTVKKLVCPPKMRFPGPKQAAGTKE
jgi:hypothetical protein